MNAIRSPECRVAPGGSFGEETIEGNQNGFKFAGQLVYYCNFGVEIFAPHHPISRSMQHEGFAEDEASVQMLNRALKKSPVALLVLLGSRDLYVIVGPL